MAHIQLIGIVEPKNEDNKIWSFPYAFPIIISQLQKTRHTFDLVDTHLHKKTRKELFDQLGRCDADIYGISSYSEGYKFTRAIAEKIRQKNKDAVIIVGGLLARSDDVLMEKTEADIAVTGAEGELILPEILDALDSGKDELRRVKGITYKDKKNSRIVKTGVRPVMDNLAYQLQERPAYEYFDEQLKELVDNINQRQGMAVKAFPVLTSRGCPFECTFCGHMYGRRFLRKNWDNFFNEMSFLQNRYGINGFYSFDTNMFMNSSEVDQYCRIYKERGCSFQIVIEMRANFGEENMYRLMKAHGVPVVTYGFESGSPVMLERMKKGVSLDRVKQTLDDAMAADMLIYGNFIFGTPGENKKTIIETRDFMFDIEKRIVRQKRSFKERGLLCTSGYNWSVLIPSPGSEIYENALKNGVIADIEKYLVSLDREDYSYEYIKFHSRFTGADVNLSAFSSRSTLKAYIRYSLVLVKFMALLYDRDRIISNPFIALGLGLKVCFLYLEYLRLRICDFLRSIKQ